MENLIYLDTYIVQQDMRIRLPKSVLSNLDIAKGETELDIFLDSAKKVLVLKVHVKKGEDCGNSKY